MNAAPPPPQDGRPVDAQPGPSAQPGPFPPGAAQQRMPASVQAARIVAFVLAALCLVNLWQAASHGGSRAAGAATAVVLLNVLLGGLALRHASGRDGLRVWSILLASLQAVVSFLSMARLPLGLVLLVGNIALIALLAQASAKRWFTRPRYHQPARA